MPAVSIRIQHHFGMRSAGLPSGRVTGTRARRRAAARSRRRAGSAAIRERMVLVLIGAGLFFKCKAIAAIRLSI
jgi:hypothetical protein